MKPKVSWKEHGKEGRLLKGMTTMNGAADLVAGAKGPDVNFHLKKNQDSSVNA